MDTTNNEDMRLNGDSIAVVFVILLSYAVGFALTRILINPEWYYYIVSFFVSGLVGFSLFFLRFYLGERKEK